jgi:hypothetical protein
VYDFFATRYRNGRFVAKDQTNFYPPSTDLDGDVIVYAFIAQPIWDAVVEDASAESDSAAPTFDADFVRAFGDNPTAREIYDGHLSEVADEVRQLAAISEFVRKHQMRWAPAGEEEQRYWKRSYDQNSTDDWFASIADARLDYRDEPAILRGLDVCADVVRRWAD